jgi:hypothetical protein
MMQNGCIKIKKRTTNTDNAMGKLLVTLFAFAPELKTTL